MVPRSLGGLSVRRRPRGRLSAVLRELQVGVVGAGNMGRGVAYSLARAGHEVWQFDLDKKSLGASVAQHASIRKGASVKDCCREVVAVTVSNEGAERQVFLGKGGVFEHCGEGSLVCNLGTTSVAWARELHGAAASAAKKAFFLDAPVSGGPEGAATASLTVMCGGSAEAFAKAKPLLEAISKKHELLGGAGAGAAAKLVNQQLVAANAHAAGEALALAFALGCDLQKLTKLIETSWGHSTMFARVSATARPVAEKTGTFTALLDATRSVSGAPLRNFVKDVALVSEAASAAGVSSTCLAPAKQVLRDCKTRNLLDVDWAAVSALATSRPSDLGSLERSSPPKILDVFAQDYRKEIKRRAAQRATVPIIDDDPTGTQTVNDVNVLSYPWRDADLDAEFAEVSAGNEGNRNNCFFVLANTRALPEDAAVDRAKTIGKALKKKMMMTGGKSSSSEDEETTKEETEKKKTTTKKQLRCVASRSDSTLRGHFPAEVDALAEGLGWEDPLIVVAPFFFEGGRLTANDVHYVADLKTGDLTPAAETEFAKDAAFGYASSNLVDWVKEKVGDSKKIHVATITLSDLRRGGPDAVVGKLLDVAKGESSKRKIVVANALDSNDAACLALGLLRAEEQLFDDQDEQKAVSGIVLRCAASLVAARCAIKKRPLLTGTDLFKKEEEEEEGTPRKKQQQKEQQKHGLVVVGSYVGKTTKQLDALFGVDLKKLKKIELSADLVTMAQGKRDAEIQRAVEEVDAGFREGAVVVLYTSRDVVRNHDDRDQQTSSLVLGDLVNDAVCRVVAEAFERPAAKNAFVVAKGGITANDVAVKALGVKRAKVLGQVVPGVPAWRLGDESKLPGAPYVVFPGNVGTDDDLANVVQLVATAGSSSSSGEEEKKSELLRGTFPGGGGDTGKRSSCGATTPTPVAFRSDHEDPERAKELLLEARRRGRAVGAFNLYNLEGAVAVRRAVDYTGLPAIVQFHPASMAFGGTALIAACQDVASTAVGAPMLVALDHADETEVIERAIHRGVDYVMADGSSRTYEDNVAWTARVVEHAKLHDVAVEAELGRLAGEEDGLAVDVKDAKMTDPNVVADFVRRTNVDALAVTIGNVHGPYAQEHPTLDWKRLDDIRRQVPDDLPLVLHGASGLPVATLHRAIRAGVCKFNVNTEVRAAARLAIQHASSQNKDLLDIMKDNVDAMTPVVTNKIRHFAPGLYPHHGAD